MFAMVSVAALAPGGALEAVAAPDGLEVTLAVPVCDWVELLDPHAAATAATTHMAANNKPAFFIVTPLD
jgi:hypothetical protein